MISADDRDRGLIVARYFIKLVFLAVFSVALQAQSTFDELNQSTQQLQIQVALDQSTYFPGEAAVGTVFGNEPNGQSATGYCAFHHSHRMPSCEQSAGRIILAAIGRPMPE